MAIRTSEWPPQEPLAEVVGTDRRRTVELSVVVPVRDEQDNVGPLYDALQRALENLNRTFEIIVVDDGSRDETYVD